MFALIFSCCVFAVRGDATYYDVGVTSCGPGFLNDQLIGALSDAHWSGGDTESDPICGRKVRVTDFQSRKSVVVTIQDKCDDCNSNDIDLSPAAFRALRPLGTGRFKVDWDFA